MKGLILILMLAVSVAAQSYDKLISIDPGTLNVVAATSGGGTTWGQCIAVCTNQCLESKKGTREECDKMCTDQCHPQPDVITKKLPPISMPPIVPKPRTCDDICAQKFKVCEDSKRGVDCKSLFEQCAKSCEPAEPCEVKCKRAATQGGDAFTGGMFDAGLYVECITKRCLVPCKKACVAAYGDASKDCIIKLCEKPTPPQSCEGRCELIRDDCKASHIEPKVCQMKIDDCKKKCKPDCPPVDICVNRCVESYYNCDLGRGECSRPLSVCLDLCHPDEQPARPDAPPRSPTCSERCDTQEGTCNRGCSVDYAYCRVRCSDAGGPTVCFEACDISQDRCRMNCLTDGSNCDSRCREETFESGPTAENAPVIESDKGAVKAEDVNRGFFARLWAGMLG